MPERPHASAARVTMGIAPRLAAITILIMCVSALLVGALVFVATNRMLVAEEERNLEQGAEAIALRLRGEVESLRTTVRLLAGTPPIPGIIRARNNGGWDALGNSTEAVWAERLATIFSVTLSSHRAYTRVRYIGVADGGRDLVRVDAADGAITRLVGPDLERAVNGYLPELARMQSGQVYLSDIELNRESGRIAEPHRPTLRAVMPIYDGDRLFGAVVADVDFLRLIEDAEQRLPTPGTRLHLTNAQGDYLARPDPSKRFGFQGGERYRVQDDLPSLAAQFGAAPQAGGGPRTGRLGAGPDLASFVKAHHDPLRPERFIGVLLVAPYDEVVNGAASLHQRLLVLSLGLILVAALVTAWFVRRQVRPLQCLTRIIERGLDADTDFSVPPRANREAQVLSRALAGMSRKVRERTDALEAANREMEAFSYTVSHDLRGPLRAINGFSGILEEEYAERLDREGRNLLTRVRDASARMDALIDGLLALSRTERQELCVTMVDLSALARGVFEELQAAEPERTVDWAIEPGLSLRADPTLLRAVLQNLAGNAWKYTRRCDPAQIRLERLCIDGREVFCLRDNGAGFEVAQAHRLFQPFSRLHADGDYPGTGIGLATVRRIIERHGGSVWAEGAVGCGAAFYFGLGAPCGASGG